MPKCQCALCRPPEGRFPLDDPCGHGGDWFSTVALVVLVVIGCGVILIGLLVGLDLIA